MNKHVYSDKNLTKICYIVKPFGGQGGYRCEPSHQQEITKNLRTFSRVCLVDDSVLQ